MITVNIVFFLGGGGTRCWLLEASTDKHLLTSIISPKYYHTIYDTIQYYNTLIARVVVDCNIYR
jgi:hypothetical protein